jgi:hypothetical protein
VSDKEPAHVTVRILEKEYFVSCPQDERADLLDSAEFLNKKMREIRDTGKVVRRGPHRRDGGAQHGQRLLRPAQAGIRDAGFGGTREANA